MLALRTAMNSNWMSETNWSLNPMNLSLTANLSWNLKLTNYLMTTVKKNSNSANLSYWTENCCLSLKQTSCYLKTESLSYLNQKKNYSIVSWNWNLTQKKSYSKTENLNYWTASYWNCSKSSYYLMRIAKTSLTNPSLKMNLQNCWTMKIAMSLNSTNRSYCSMNST